MIRSLQKGDLPEAAASTGITRHLAFRGEGFVIVHSRVEPGVISGWHHHGDYDVYGYLASGSARFDNGPGGMDAVTVGPGDFFHVPARAVHRGVNPSHTESLEMILFLRGTGPTVINVDGPERA